MIWFKDYKLSFIENIRSGGMSKHIGLEFTEVGPDFLKAKMPVDQRTTQPFGILHGGASCVLSESLGSVAAWMTIDPDKFRAVGLEINANHIRAVTEGYVIGTCTPIHVGKRTQVWQTDIVEESTGKRVCISRLTVAVIEQGTLSAQKKPISLRNN
jgi:1,4-dihydroxy-2-naphthoyl-CoA hydrolase